MTKFISVAEIHAYTDNQLTESQARSVEQGFEHQPEKYDELQDYLLLNDKVRAQFDFVASEPVPQFLIDFVQSGDSSGYMKARTGNSMTRSRNLFSMENTSGVEWWDSLKEAINYYTSQWFPADSSNTTTQQKQRNWSDRESASDTTAMPAPHNPVNDDINLDSGVTVKEDAPVATEEAPLAQDSLDAVDIPQQALDQPQQEIVHETHVETHVHETHVHETHVETHAQEAHVQEAQGQESAQDVEEFLEQEAIEENIQETTAQEFVNESLAREPVQESQVQEPVPESQKQDPLEESTKEILEQEPLEESMQTLEPQAVEVIQPYEQESIQQSEQQKVNESPEQEFAEQTAQEFQEQEAVTGEQEEVQESIPEIPEQASASENMQHNSDTSINLDVQPVAENSEQIVTEEIEVIVEEVDVSGAMDDVTSVSASEPSEKNRSYAQTVIVQPKAARNVLPVAAEHIRRRFENPRQPETIEQRNHIPRIFRYIIGWFGSNLITAIQDLWRGLVSTRLVPAIVLLLLGVSLGWMFAGGQNALYLNANTTNDRLHGLVLNAHQFYSSDERTIIEAGGRRYSNLLGWLATRLGKNLQSNDLSELGYKRVGSILLPTSDQYALLTLYENNHKQNISVIITAAQSGSKSRQCKQSTPSVAVCLSVHEGLNYAVATDLSLKETQHLSDIIQFHF